MSGKLNLLGLEKAQTKSTACHGMRNRDNKFFEDAFIGSDGAIYVVLNIPDEVVRLTPKLD